MKMDYSFIRQLSLPLEEEAFQQITDLLLARGIELYVRKDEGQFELFFEPQKAEMCKEEDRVLYVASADRKEAVRLMEEANLGLFVSKEIQPINAESELERAKELYYRRRKITMVAWGVILLLAFAFYLVKAYLL